MSGWFTKASNVFRRAAPEVEHPFELTCDCGLAHHGLRRARHQRIVCRDCGASRFVLPRDVYPAPREARTKPKPAPEPLPVLAPVEEKPVDLAVDRDEPKAATKGRPSKRKTVERDSAPEFLVVKDQRRFWTPLRFISLGIAAALVLIAVILVQKQRRDWATSELRTAGDAALAAAAAGDWNAARDNFARAVKAVNILGRDNASSRRIRQGLRETEALTGLNSESLGEMLESADRQADKPDDWKRNFDLRYRGSWVVLESLLKKVEGDDGEEYWSVVYPYSVGEESRRVVIRADLDAFKSLKRLSPEQPVVFAAQLDSCELSKSKKEWNIALRSESGFLWADPVTYGGLGFAFSEWHPEEEVKLLLRDQAKRINVEFEEAAPQAEGTP